ncbi:MAG: hypothetical protein WCA48_24785 [Pseudomonas gingeri]
MTEITSIVWPLVIVGRGSTAAYYVATVDLSVFKKVLAIGEDDPWAGARGHSGNATDPTLKINHPLHLLEHFKQTIPGYSESLVDRLEWSKLNTQVLQEADVQIEKRSVKMVSDCIFPSELAPEEVRGFLIELTSGEKVYAYKVVIAAGAGGHRVPPELKKARELYPYQVLDLDEFAGLSPSKLDSSKSVVVIGPNAAIDAVHKALNYKMSIHWLINLEEGKTPPMLATQPRMHEAWNNPGKHNLKVYRFSSYTSVPKIGRRVGVTVIPSGVGKHPTTVEGDYIVYAMGQTGGPVELISNAIKAKLKPIYDTSNAVNPQAGDRQMSERAILGYEAEGTGLRDGLEVMGALSAQMGRALKTSKDRLTVLAEQISEIRKDQTVWTAITSLFPVMLPFLGKDPDYLAKQPRAPLGAQLRTEIDHVARKYPSDRELKAALEALANLLLAYHTASAYESLGAQDPNNLGNFAKLLNLVATALPRGAVSDSGQLTSVNAAIRAYATIKGPLPNYMPTQHVLPTRTHDGKLQGFTTPNQINWNLDSLHNVAIFVCASYPSIPSHEANAFIDEVLMARSNSKIGFTDHQVSLYLSRLAFAEGNALKQVFNKV